MKKGGFLISSVVLMAILFSIQSKRNVDDDKARLKHNSFRNRFTQIEKEVPRSEETNQLIDQSSEIAQDEAMPNLEVLRQQVPTLAEIEREYKAYRSDELAHEYQISKEKVEHLQLVEKANTGKLSDEDAKNLMTEMRRQGVLTQLRLKGKVEAVKRKYL